MDQNYRQNSPQPEIEYFAFNTEEVQIVHVAIHRATRQLFLGRHRDSLLGRRIARTAQRNIEPGFGSFNIAGDILADAVLYLTEQRRDRFVFWNLYGVEPEVVPYIHGAYDVIFIDMLNRAATLKACWEAHHRNHISPTIFAWQNAHNTITFRLERDPRLNPFNTPRSPDIDEYRREWEQFGRLQGEAEAEFRQRLWDQAILRARERSDDSDGDD